MPLAFDIDDESSSSDHRLGDVRLLLDTQPWHMLVALKGLKISSRGMIALLSQSADQFLSTQDIDAELHQGRQYRLQIDYDGLASTDPFTGAELIEKRRTRSGLELGFSFIGDDATTEPLFQD